MKVTISKDKLLDVVGSAASVVDSKGDNPILRNIKLSVADGAIVASGSHLIEEVACTVAAEVSAPGAVGVNAKDIVDRVKAMPSGAVTISLSGEQLQIQSGKRKHVLPTISGDQFPPFGSPKERMSELSAAALVTALNRIRHCIDTDTTRPGMNGARVEFGDLALSVAGTNGKTLGFTKVPIGPGKICPPIVLPLRAIGSVLRLIADADTILVCIDGPWFWVRNDSMLYGAKLLDATFPPFEYAVQPTMRPRQCRASRAALIDSCKSAALGGKDPIRLGLLRFDFAPGAIGISASGAGAAASDQIDAEYDGPALTIGMYAENIVAAATAIDGDDVRVCFGMSVDSFHPVSLLPADGEDNIQIVMPVRLD